MKSTIVLVFAYTFILVASHVHAGYISTEPGFVENEYESAVTDSNGRYFVNIPPDGTVEFHVVSPNTSSRIDVDTDSSTFTNGTVSTDDDEDTSDVDMIVTFNDSAKGLVNPCKFKIQHYDENDNYCTDGEQEVDIDVNVIKLTLLFNVTAWSDPSTEDTACKISGFASGNPPTINSATTYSGTRLPSQFCIPYEYKVTVAPSGSYVQASDVTIVENAQQYTFFWLDYVSRNQVGYLASTGTYASDGDTYFAQGGTASDPNFYWVDFPSITTSAAQIIYNPPGVTAGELETDLSSTPNYKTIQAGDTQTQSFYMYWSGSPLVPSN